MLFAPVFPLTPAGYFGAMVHRMLEWLTVRVRRADQGYQPALSPDARAQTLAIHRRMASVGRMFARLAELARTGSLRSYPDRASPRPRAGAAVAARPASPAMPAGRDVAAMRGPGWMLAFVPADFARQMTALLAIGDVVALIQTAPPVARLVRPLCRGLGVVPPPGVFPPAPHRPRPPRRRPTNDAHAAQPTASDPRHRAVGARFADADFRREPRPWHGPAGPSVTSYWDERDAHRERVRRRPR